MKLLNRYHRAITNLSAVAKPAIGFEFWFGLIAVIVFAPAGAWLLNQLVAYSGQRAISNNDLVAFFLSSHGIFFFLLSFGMALAMWFAEQVGLFVISTAAVFDRKISVSLALREKIISIPALVRLGLLRAVFYAAAGIPFVCGVGLTYWLFLWAKDINYYLTARPWEWWAALAVAGGSGSGGHLRGGIRCGGHVDVCALAVFSAGPHLRRHGAHGSFANKLATNAWPIPGTLVSFCGVVGRGTWHCYDYHVAD